MVSLAGRWAESLQIFSELQPSSSSFNTLSTRLSWPMVMALQAETKGEEGRFEGKSLVRYKVL